jgi:outer membrane protein OmpA-like peptidoglycan-associated protein
MILLFIITSLYLAKLKEHQQPPLIVLNETSGYSFNSSSASLNSQFKSQLTSSVVKKINKFSKEYKCDIVEVYGYTDAEPFGGSVKEKRFDEKLHTCLVRGCNIDKIEASSNLELGMKRAVAVVDFLKPKLIINTSYIKTIRPYSAGQFIDERGEIALMDNRVDNKFRRRIEIRLSRSRDFRRR